MTQVFECSILQFNGLQYSWHKKCVVFNVVGLICDKYTKKKIRCYWYPWSMKNTTSQIRKKQFDLQLMATKAGVH
jgi:hypothetical protein